MTGTPHRVLYGLVAAALVACGAETGPPPLVLDRSACARCGMLISEARFAAAYRAGDEAAVFDDIGCLLGALEDSGLATDSGAGGAPSAGEHAEVWFLDRDEHWLRAAEVVFVRSTGLTTPMGGGIQAVASRADAAELAAKTGGSIFETLDELRRARRAGWTVGSQS